MREGVKACARLNNESDLEGNKSLHSSRVECLFSPLVGSGTTDNCPLWTLPDMMGACLPPEQICFDLLSVIILIDMLSKGWESPHGSGSLIWYCSSIEEHLLCFWSKQFPCQLSTTQLPNQQPFWSDFYIRLCQNDAHFKYYSSINISERSCLLYLHICLTDVPYSSRQFHILPSDAVDTSASLRIRVIADCRINNSICFMNAGEGVVLLWRLIQSKPSEPTLLEMLVFFAPHVKEMIIYP